MILNTAEHGVPGEPAPAQIPIRRRQVIAHETLCGVLLLLLAVSTNGEPVTVGSDKMLDRIAIVESRGRDRAVGDKGRSLGAYQMSRGAWMDVSAHRRAKGQRVYPWTAAHNRTVARAYAREYLLLIEGWMVDGMGRRPSVAEVYAAYNMGFGDFRKIGFRLDRASQKTRENARIVGL